MGEGVGPHRLVTQMSPISVTRTVVCSDPDMTLPPASLPPDTSRLRLERTAIRRVPGEVFKPLGRLEQLWLPYNALSELSALMLRGLRRLRELRLPGNRLAAFPWAALKDAPPAAAAGPASQPARRRATRGRALPGEPHLPRPLQQPAVEAPAGDTGHLGSPTDRARPSRAPHQAGAR